MITLGEIEARIENGKFDPALKLKLAVDAYRLHLKHIFGVHPNSTQHR